MEPRPGNLLIPCLKINNKNGWGYNSVRRLWVQSPVLQNKIKQNIKKNHTERNQLGRWG